MTPRGEGDSVFLQKLGALGERVRAFRGSRDWSQQELADHTGIGRPKISEIESGKHNLTLEVLWRLADAFGAHWADLIDNRTPARPPVPQRTFDQQLGTFGTRVYQARVLQRMTQRELSDRTRIGRSAISDIEDGTQNVTLKTLHGLATGLGVDWADLIDDRRTTPPQPLG
jgi:transcriptional regulator with XRE-family HTH domain